MQPLTHRQGLRISTSLLGALRDSSSGSRFSLTIRGDNICLLQTRGSGARVFMQPWFRNPFPS